MSAFQFPDPASEQEVTNPSTGSTYVWKADPGKWVIVSSSVEMPDFPELVTYEIQTDRTFGESQPGINLMDTKDLGPAAINSTVNIIGSGGIEVTSNLNTIMVDGSNFAADINLEGYATEVWTLQKIEEAHLEGEDVDLSNYLTIPAFNEGQDIQNQTTTDNTAAISQNSLDIAELQITKGRIARYVISEIGLGIAARNGDLIVNNAAASEVTFISFADFDVNGRETKAANSGDLLEFVETSALDDNGVRTSGDTARYKVVSGETSALTVEYISGTNNFEVGEAEEVFTYPQQKQTVSKEYVDAQDELLYPRTGGNITGAIRSRLSDKANTANFEILNPDGSRSFYLWNPGGAGKPIMNVCGKNNEYVIKNENSSGESNISAEFGFKYVSLYGAKFTPQNRNSEESVSHSIGTKHTFKGRAIFETAVAGENGFTLKGNSSLPNEDLLNTYHNGGGQTLDAINYGGKTSSATNIQTKQSVEDLIKEKGVVMQSGTNSNPTLSTGQMYWNSDSKVLYIGN